MLRVCPFLCSNALHNSTPFVDGALQLVKLHLAHKNAASDGNAVACRAIESEFLREVEAFRPCFTMSSSLSVASRYTRRLSSALSYFGLHDDPLARQLALIAGRQGMRRDTDRFAGTFRIPVAAPPSSSSSAAAQLEESAESLLPTELPNPPRPDPTAPRRDGALQLPVRHRGHWVLRDPEIAITREERRTDPWGCVRVRGEVRWSYDSGQKFKVMSSVCIPPSMTSGVPCVLSSCAFPTRVESDGDFERDGTRWVHRTAHLLGEVSPAGRALVEEMAVIRGDVSAVSFGDGVILRARCVVRPPLRSLFNRGVAEAASVYVGGETLIGRRVVCEAQSIGCHVLVEDECVVGEWAELPDGVWLRAGCVVPPGVRLAPFVVYAGQPAQAIATTNAALHRRFMQQRIHEVFTALQRT